MHHDAGTASLMRDDGPMYVQREEAGDTASEQRTSEDDADHAHPYPRITSFRSRRSALSGTQRETWDRRWPELGMQARDSDGRPSGLLDAEEWFGRSAPLILEIGCGTGVSTAAMAAAEPDLDVIAVEVYRRGLAQLLTAVDRDGLTNVRLVRGDGVDVLDQMLTANSLIGVRVFFPDPWPKVRHHKRRLLQPATVAMIADRLSPGGILHAATDHAEYAQYIAEVGAAEPSLRRVPAGDAETTAHLPIAVHRPVTKYEGKAQRAGSAVTELLWEKRR